MNIKRVTKSQKSSFNKSAVHPLQTWEWGEFRKEHGNKVIRLAGFESLQDQKNKFYVSYQIIFSKIPKTKYTIGTLIRGPKPTKLTLDVLKKLAKEENAIFIKLEPSFAKATEGQAKFSKITKLLKENGCVPGKTLFTPTSFWIDLTKSEDELLKSFSGKTRYNIRYAQRKGVTVVEDNSEKAFEKYLTLTRETVERQGFYAHSEKYHRLMWKFLQQSPIAKHQPPIAHLLTAVHKKEIITAWILFSWKDFLYYPYGASTDRHKNVQANSLMMWEAIRFGKKLSLKTFDLWGREEGKGFTKFKEGFSPQVVKFIGTWDLVTSPLYWPYRVAEYFRWQFLRTKTKFRPAKPKF